MHRYLIFDLLTFIPFLSNAYLQHSGLRTTSFLISSQITISSPDSIAHDGSLLTSSVSLSIITVNRNGLNADPWCSPTLTLKLSVVLTAHLTTVSFTSYISCTSRTYFFAIPDFLIQVAHTFSPFLIFSYFFAIPDLRTSLCHCNCLLCLTLLFFVHLLTFFISCFVPCFLCLFLLFYALLYFLIPPPCLPVSFSFLNVTPSTVSAVFLAFPLFCPTHQVTHPCLPKSWSPLV